MSDGKSIRPAKPVASKPAKPAPKLASAVPANSKPVTKASKPAPQAKGAVSKGSEGKKDSRPAGKVGGIQKGGSGSASSPKAKGGESDKKRKRVEKEVESEPEEVTEDVEVDDSEEAEEVDEDVTVEEAEELDQNASLSQKEQVALEARAAELFVIDGLTWLTNFCDEIDVPVHNDAIKQAMYSTLAVVANKFLKIRDGGIKQNKHTAPYNAKKIAKIATELSAKDAEEEMEE